MSAVLKTDGKRRIGDGTPGPGRPKGLPNKTTASVKAALTEAFEGMGGVEALMTWGKSKPSEFYSIWSKLIPAEIKAELTGANGAPLLPAELAEWLNNRP